jgi:hypothetical protein
MNNEESKTPVNTEILPDYMVSRLPPKDYVDTNPLKIDVRDYKQDTCFIEYVDGVEFRKQLGDKLTQATSVEFVNIPDPSEPPHLFITISNKFLTGLLEDFILSDGTKPITAPTAPLWFQARLKMVSVAVINSLGCTDAILNALEPVCGNPMDINIYGEDAVKEYDGRATFLAMFRDDPRKIRRLHSYVCELKDLLDSYEGIYYRRMGEWFAERAGRWIKVFFGPSVFEDECNRDIFPRIKYGDKTIVATGLVAKIGGANLADHDINNYPFVSDKDTPVFYIGYDANQEETGHDDIYPVLDGEQRVKCNIQYTEDIDPSDWMRGHGDGHDRKKHDRWKLVRSELVFPTSLMKFYGTPRFNDVYDKPNGKFYKFVAPTNETK